MTSGNGLTDQASRKQPAKAKSPRLRRQSIFFIRGIWLATLVGVIMCANIRLPVSASFRLTVSELHLQTRSHSILSSSDEDEVLISGFSSVHIRRSSPSSNHLPETMDISGEPFAACTFARMRMEPIQLSGNSLLELRSDPEWQAPSLGIGLEQPVVLGLASQRAEGKTGPAFTCTRVHSRNERSGEIDDFLSASGGDSILVETRPYSRVDLRGRRGTELTDVHLAVFGPLSFVHIDPLSKDEKPVLIKPASGNNTVIFGDMATPITIDETKLLFIEPQDDFWIERLTAGRGINLQMHGTVSGVEIGDGPGDYQNPMPTLLSKLVDNKAIFLLIPGVASWIVEVLVRMRILRAA
jgi:hypothetical protein